MRARALRLPPLSGTTRTQCLEYAALADRLGIDAIWVGEAWGRNAVVLLTQIAERVDDADVGAGIFNVYSRTPGLIAMTAAALSDVAPAGVRIGLGASGPAVVEHFHGRAFESPLRRTRECIEIVDALLSGETGEYDGRVFDLSGFALDPPATHDVPVYNAAMGEKNLELTGEFADGWLPLYVPVERFERAIATIERGARRRDRSIEDVDVAPYLLTCVSDDDPGAARDAVRGVIAFYVGAMGEYYHRTVSRFGYAAEADRIRAAWRDGERERARAAVTDEMLDAFAVCGSSETAAASLERFEAAGVDTPVGALPSTASEELLRETIDGFARL
jgi:coenzyme F420-dependent oxidoreductase